jgi:hypothetical protein
MNQAEQQRGFSVVAVYPGRDAAQRAISRLRDDGFDMRNVSLIGRDVRVGEAPAGVVTTGDVASEGAGIGAVAGGIIGLCVGTAFLVLPGVGPLIVAGPIAAALAGAGEGALAGAVVGGLAGALVGWGVPEVHAVKYETRVKGGEFLVVVRGDASTIEHAKTVLGSEGLDHLETFEESPNMTKT